jgi:hypothetical protein
MLPGTHFQWWRAVLLSRFPESLRIHKKTELFKSAPTSTEGALRLLRGKFWQQTAFCPVSLWALVVKLHPLNWARAHAVRRINQFSGCSSTTNARNETGQMAVCCQNLPLGTLSIRSAHSSKYQVQKLFVELIGRTACGRAQFSGCSSTTNAHTETGQMAVCCQNLPLGALSSRSAHSVMVGELFKSLYFENRCMSE